LENYTICVTINLLEGKSLEQFFNAGLQIMASPGGDWGVVRAQAP